MACSSSSPNQVHASISSWSRIDQLYETERQAKDLNPLDRQRLRQKQARPVADALFEWMRLQRIKVTDGSVTAKALDYTLKRWQA